MVFDITLPCNGDVFNNAVSILKNAQLVAIQRVC